MTTTLLPRTDWLARLRSVMVLRPGQRVAHVPGIGVRTSRRAVSSGAVSLHVEDSFTAADGTNLNGWTPDVANTPGNTWTAMVQNWSIISGRARGTNYQASELVIECGATDGLITMPVAWGGFENGILFRYVDTNNYWVAKVSTSVSYVLIERTAGTNTTRASFLGATSALSTMAVLLSGNDILVSWEGVDLTYTSAQHATATKHGIYRRDWTNTGCAEWWKMVS